MIKLIIFDNEGVLLRQERDKVFEEAHEIFGITKDQVNRVVKDFGILDSVGVKFNKSLREAGSLTYNVNKNVREEFWKKALELYNINPSHENVDKLSSCMYKLIGKPFKDVEELAIKLRKIYRVVILTNTLPEIMSATSKRIDLSIFHKVYASYEIGVRKDKDNPEAYDYVIKKEKVKPNEAIFIDDKKSNVKTANDYGLHGIYFKGQWGAKYLLFLIDKVILDNQKK